MIGLTRVTLRLGRNPQAGFPEGDDHNGYVIYAPLDADLRLDPHLWAQRKRECTVRRFRPGEAASDGWLRHRGAQWFFWYDEADEGPAEDVDDLGGHRLAIGEYVTVREGGGVPLTFRVADAVRV